MATPMNPKSASALAWFALIVNVLGLIVLALEAQFAFSVFAALLVLFPTLFARGKARMFTGAVLIVSLALAVSGYLRFAQSPYMQRWRVADHSADYIEAGSGMSIAIELFHTHPFFAEYQRELVLSLNGKELNRQILDPDTGGYSAANLYKCGAGKYQAKGYFDSWIINIDDFSISEGECAKESREFVGAFRGAGSKPWIFYPASARAEQLLEPTGG